MLFDNLSHREWSKAFAWPTYSVCVEQRMIQITMERSYAVAKHSFLVSFASAVVILIATQFYNRWRGLPVGFYSCQPEHGQHADNGLFCASSNRVLGASVLT